MASFEIQSKSKKYPVIVTNSFKEITRYIDIKPNSKLVIITDENVNRLYIKEFTEAISNLNCTLCSYIIVAGEESKSLQTTQKIYQFLLEQQCGRKDIIVALGGGVVGDVAGYVAATYMRGIHLVQVPTTLLAQVDSSLGGKNGLNFKNIKNVIGTFYQPDLVYININVLKTLEQRQIASGIAEIMIHALIKDKQLLDKVVDNSVALFNKKEDVLQNIILESCKIKGRIVSEDEFDQGNRAILNLGHTIGHAIEGASNYALSHGESIAIGTMGAFKIANRMGLISEELIMYLEQVLVCLRLPCCSHGVVRGQVYSNIYHDKKKEGLKLYFILPVKIGEVKKIAVENQLLKEVLQEIILD